MNTKVWWVDTTDFSGAQVKIDSAKRGKLSEWDWNKFDESLFDSKEEATSEFLAMLLTPPAFSPGKVISCQSIPLRSPEKCQAKVLESLAEIPENVLLLIATPIDRVCALYKAISKMGNKALVEESVELEPKNVVKWIQERAASYKLTLDATACNLLGDQAGLNPGKICRELEKLRAFSQDGHISAKMVEATVFGFGSVNVFQIGKAIVEGQEEVAHERLQRLLDRGDEPEGIFAVLQDYLLKLCFVEGCGRNLAAAQLECKEVRKWKRGVPTETETVKSKNENENNEWGPSFVRFKGESVPAFPNPSALSHACNDLKRNKLPAWWAYDAYRRLGKLQLSLRKDRDKDAGKMLHSYINEAIECQR